jgi:hypothetical protein
VREMETGNKARKLLPHDATQGYCTGHRTIGRDSE